ncbi:MAG: peptidoglycan-binding protein [Pseudomonadota bacterium]
MSHLSHGFKAALTASLIVTGSASQADNAVKFGAAALGILCVSGAICNTGKKNSNSGAAATVSPQRQQNMQVQSALNGFNFPVGTVDGSLGPNSRSAIADYQSYMGWPPTGQLTDYERNILTQGWDRYNQGAGAQYPNTMAALGNRGMLKITENPAAAQQYGDGNQYATGQGTTGATQQASFPQQATTTVPNTATQPSGNLPLQPLQPVGQTTSMASHCEVSNLTAQTMGVVDPNTQPELALDVKFCEARSFAMAQSDYQADQFKVSEAQLTQSCQQIAAAFGPNITSLASLDVAQVASAAKQTAANPQLGLADPTAASTYGQICLGLGYKQDDATMALAGDLLLVSAGQDPYGEVLGHHLRKGFGVTTNTDLAVAWYKSSMASLSAGAQPAFEPSTTQQRVQTINTAVANGGSLAPGNSGTADTGGLPPLSLQQ